MISRYNALHKARRAERAAEIAAEKLRYDEAKRRDAEQEQSTAAPAPESKPAQQQQNQRHQQRR